MPALHAEKLLASESTSVRRPEIKPLLAAVRRRLWRRQLVSAVRLSLWASAGLALFAVAAHLALRPVSLDVAIVLLALPWAALMARAGWRRPSDAACALWADRHLGGASAYTTLLEFDALPQGAGSACARERLETWVAARVPQSLALLAGQPEVQGLSRPLVVMLVCAAFAAFVLALPGLAPTPAGPMAAASASGAGDLPPLRAQAPASAEPLSEVASALRSMPQGDAPARGPSGRTQVARPGQADDSAAPAMTEPGAMPQAARANGVPSRLPSDALAAAPGAAADAADAAGRAAGAGSGREAGDSRDERVVVGTSRASPKMLPVQRFEVAAGRETAARQADPDRVAAYADDTAGASRPGRPAGPVAAAAAPPAATEATPLTATEARYVRAWLMANHGRP